MDALDPRTTALVLVDLQKGILGFPLQPNSSAAVLGAGAQLAKRFRAAGATVVLTRVTWAADFADALQQPVDRPLPGPAELPVEWAAFPPELEQGPRDIIVTKRQWGAFHGTELDLQLRRRGIKTIVLGGIATNMGVESTARQAWEHGYEIVFADDAISSINPELHSFAMQSIFPIIGRVRRIADIMASVKSVVRNTAGIAAVEVPGDSRFKGKVALITGAAGGMGAATAIELARLGAAVMAVDINGDGAEATASSIRAGGGAALSYAGDVANVDTQ